MTKKYSEMNVWGAEKNVTNPINHSHRNLLKAPSVCTTQGWTDDTAPLSQVTSALKLSLAEAQSRCVEITSLFTHCSTYASFLIGSSLYYCRSYPFWYPLFVLLQLPWAKSLPYAIPIRRTRFGSSYFWYFKTFCWNHTRTDLINLFLRLP